MVGVVLFVSLFVVYAPVFWAGFVWDDDDHFLANPAMESGNGLVEIWTSGRAIYYPLTLTAWWVLRHFFDTMPLAFHLPNLLCHGSTALLLAMLLARWRFPAPALAAALWMLHPVNVETAAWATELKNTLSGLLMLTSLHAWLSYLRARDGGGWFYAAAVASLALALLAKPSTVPGPALLLLATVWENKRLRGRDALALALPFALAMAWAGWTIHEQKFNSNAQGPEWSLTLAQRLLLAANTPIFYLQKILVPYPISFIYPRWEMDAPGVALLARPLVMVGLVAAAINAVLADRDPRGVPMALALGGLAWLALLFPVCGLFVIYFQRFSYVADHFQYLASMIPCVAMVYAIHRVLPDRARLGVLVALIVLGSGWSNRLVVHYKDEETLWRRTLVTNPQAWIAWNNLGFILWERGDNAEATHHIERALALKPDYDEALNNLGVIALNEGKPAEAELLFRQAIEVRPTYGTAMSNLASALASQGQIDEALHWQFEAIKRMRPDASLFADLGTLLVNKGRFDDAIAAYEHAVKLAPESIEYNERLRLLRQIARPPGQSTG